MTTTTTFTVIIIVSFLLKFSSATIPREYEYTCANETSYLKVRFSISTKRKTEEDCTLKKLKLKDFHVIDQTNINLEEIYNFVQEPVIVRYTEKEFDSGSRETECLECARIQHKSDAKAIVTLPNSIAQNRNDADRGPLGFNIDLSRDNLDEYDDAVISGNSTSEDGTENWFDPRFVARHLHLYLLNRTFYLRFIPFVKPVAETPAQMEKRKGLCVLDAFTDELGLNYYIDYGEQMPCTDLIPFAKNLFIKKGYFWIYYVKSKNRRYRVLQFKKKCNERRVVCKIQIM